MKARFLLKGLLSLAEEKPHAGVSILRLEPEPLARCWNPNWMFHKSPIICGLCPSPNHTRLLSSSFIVDISSFSPLYGSVPVALRQIQVYKSGKLQ
jgi:hypothetical protein